MFSTRLPLLAAILAGIDIVTSLTCDEVWVTIANQTDIDFYKTCPTAGVEGGWFFIDHEFKGPFELPGVESIPKLSSGYLLPKLPESARVDDGVTSISMPDLINITTGGLSIGYINNLTSLSMPKLKTISGPGGLGIVDCNAIEKLSFPSLETVDGAILLDGYFSEVSFPSLKSVLYLQIISGNSNLDCPALGKALASLNFTAESEGMMGEKGFLCRTPDENNRWNSSEPNGKDGDSDGTSGGVDDGAADDGKADNGAVGGGVDKDSAGGGLRVGYSVGTLLLVTGIVLCL